MLWKGVPENRRSTQISIISGLTVRRSP